MAAHATDASPPAGRGSRGAAHWVACYESWGSRRPWAFSLATALALVAAATAVLHPAYDTNDDVLMTMIVSGKGFCLAPDAHLIFTNVLVGQALRGLYLAAPAVPWYGGYLLSLHVLAQWGLLYCVIAGCYERGRFGLYLLYFALVELCLLNNLQYTTTAFLAAQSGGFLCLVALRCRANASGVRATGTLVAGACLIVVAALVRFESCALAALLLLPACGWLGTAWRMRRVLLPALTTGGAILAMIAACEAYNRHAYHSDPAWRGFFDYNALRCKFNDYGWTYFDSSTAPVFAKVGWTENDHAMIRRWFFDDPLRYSEENLRSIVTGFPWKSARLSASYYWESVRPQIRDRSLWAVALALPFFLSGRPRSSAARRSVAASLVMAGLLLTLLAVNNKPPPARVYFPLWSFPLALALLVSEGSIASGRARSSGSAPVGLRSLWQARSPTGRFVVALLVVGLAMGVYRQGRRSVRVHFARGGLQTLLVQLRPADDKLFICWQSAFPYELLSPLDSLRGLADLRLFNFVWTQRTPWQQAMKERFGIVDIVPAAFERDDVYLLADPAYLPYFSIYAREHYGADVRFSPTAGMGKGLVAGRFTMAQGARTAQRGGPAAASQ